MVMDLPISRRDSFASLLMPLIADIPKWMTGGQLVENSAGPSFEAAAAHNIPRELSRFVTGEWATGSRRGAASYIADPNVTPSYQASHRRSSFIGSDGRGWRLDTPIVHPEMLGAGNGDPSADTAAFREAIAAFKAVLAPAGATYYLADEVSQGNSFTLLGIEGETGKPHIRVTAPGITPFSCSSAGGQCAISGVAIDFKEVVASPALWKAGYDFAAGVEVPSASIGTVRGELRLHVPTGGLTRLTSAGSMVVVLDERSRGSSCWANNFADLDDIFQITSIIDDHNAILAGRAGYAVSNARLHVRGNAMSIIWRVHQPTNIIFDRNNVGNVPGAGLMSMGAQHLHFTNNMSLGGGAPHIAALFSGNGEGSGFLSGSAVNHHNRCVSNMFFNPCGGYIINGWLDSEIRDNQIDQNAKAQPAIANCISNRWAPFILANLRNCTVSHLTPEDSGSPDGVWAYQCVETKFDQIYGFDLSPGSHTMHMQAGSLSTLANISNGDKGSGDKALRFTQGSAANEEVLEIGGGRNGLRRRYYNNKAGAYGAAALVTDARDGMWIKRTLTREEIKLQRGSTYAWNVDLSDTLGSSGFDFFLIESILLDHGPKPWAARYGKPQIRAGSSLDPDALFSFIDLSATPGSYMLSANITGLKVPAAFVSGALGASPLLRLEVRDSGGGSLADPQFACGDVTLYVKAAGIRS